MDNIKEVNGINIENIGKLNAVTKGYFKNKSGVSYERYPYDEHHIHVYRMMEASGTTVKDYVGSSNGTANSGLAIDTGYGINKKSRDWATTGYWIQVPDKTPIGAMSIRYKIYVKSTFANKGTILDSCDVGSNPTNHGVVSTITAEKRLATAVVMGSGTDYIQLYGTKILENEIWYDVMSVWDGTTNANGAKLYIKALTGTDAGKWYDTSNVAQSYMTPNHEVTSVLTASNAATYNIKIGKPNVFEAFNLTNCKIQDLQISNIARTDMKEYI